MKVFKRQHRIRNVLSVKRRCVRIDYTKFLYDYKFKTHVKCNYCDKFFLWVRHHQCSKLDTDGVWMSKKKSIDRSVLQNKRNYTTMLQYIDSVDTYTIDDKKDVYIACPTAISVDDFNARIALPPDPDNVAYWNDPKMLSLRYSHISDVYVE